MKVLNRPMFRMGGPIKEGIMSGIKEPRQRYQDAGSVFKNVENLLATDQPRGDVLQGAAELGIASPYKQNVFKPYMKKVVTKPTNLEEVDMATIGGYGEIEKPYLEFEKIPKYIDDIDGDGIRDLNPEYVKNKTFINDIFGGPYQKKTGVTTPTPVKTGTTIQDNMPDRKIDINKDNTDPTPDVEKTKKQRVDDILSSLGYKRAQKNALYDAMIKAGQRISRTGLGAENLVSDVIAETSQSYDKPEKLREAAQLMATQQDLKLEQIEAGKTGGTLQQSYEYFLDRGFSDEESQLKAAGLATNIQEAKSIGLKQNLKGNQLTESVAQQLILTDTYRNPTYKGTINAKEYKSVSEFAKSKDFDGAGVYIVKGRIVELDENGNKIKEDIVTSSSSDKKWWNPLD